MRVNLARKSQVSKARAPFICIKQRAHHSFGEDCPHSWVLREFRTAHCGDTCIFFNLHLRPREESAIEFTGAAIIKTVKSQQISLKPHEEVVHPLHICDDHTVETCRIKSASFARAGYSYFVALDLHNWSSLTRILCSRPCYYYRLRVL